MEKHITLPLTEELAKTLHAGDTVYLTGTIYTSRDAGHKRMCEALARGEKIPFDPTDATIYYVGPTPAKPGQVIGSAGLVNLDYVDKLEDSCFYMRDGQMIPISRNFYKLSKNAYYHYRLK